MAISGSTSAWALSVSISTARLDCTIFWSADACARLMSDDTSLYAVLIAASADSTSGGGSIPVISDASSVIPYRASDECAFPGHVIVDVAQVFPQIVDRNADRRRRQLRLGVGSTAGFGGGASKFAIRSRSTDTKYPITCTIGWPTPNR